MMRSGQTSEKPFKHLRNMQKMLHRFAYQYVIAIIVCYPLRSHRLCAPAVAGLPASKLSLKGINVSKKLVRLSAKNLSSANRSTCFMVFVTFKSFLHIARSLLLASANLESSVGQMDMCFCQSVPSKLLRIIVWLQPLQSTQWDLNTHSHLNHFITPCSNVLQWFTRAQENQKKERTSRTLVIYKM